MPPQTRQSRRWVFTLNNYTPAEEQRVKDVFASASVRYGVFGRETGAGGTPHLQGFCVFTGNQRFNAVRRLFPRAHVESARGTTQQARSYCIKDGDYFECGDPPTNAGSRSDLEALFEWGDQFTAEHGRGPTSPEVAREQPQAYLRYPRIVRLFENRAPPPVLREGELRDWQSFLEQELDEGASDREVVFYVDPDGGKGKTWFQQWYLSKHPDKVQVLSIGKRDDLAHAIDVSKSVFFFNVPRGGMEYFQYVIAESLKDRMIFSPKYSSKMKFLRTTPHVIVFCNEEPDYSKMTEDRYVVRNPDNTE